MAKLALGIVGGLLVALLAGWIWGRSGQSDTAHALQTAELRSDLLGARAAVLDARVAIYSVNFGEASAHLENARDPCIARTSGSSGSTGAMKSNTWRRRWRALTTRNAWLASWIKTRIHARARRRGFSRTYWTPLRNPD